VNHRIVALRASTTQCRFLNRLPQDALLRSFRGRALVIASDFCEPCASQGFARNGTISPGAGLRGSCVKMEALDKWKPKLN
jgi:hypothetical protein